MLMIALINALYTVAKSEANRSLALQHPPANPIEAMSFFARIERPVLSSGGFAISPCPYSRFPSPRSSTWETLPDFKAALADFPRHCLFARAAEVRKANSAHPLGLRLVLELGETTTKLGHDPFSHA
jgi:hypothetical protein